MRPIESINRVLVDRTNWEQLKPTLLAKVAAANLMGLTFESQ